jgi:hypothetical protein
MNDDIPLGEPFSNRLWIVKFPGTLNLGQQRQIALFLKEAAGSALAIDPNTDLTKLQTRDLLALAVRAYRHGAGPNIVGSFLALSAERGSLIAIAILAQFIAHELRRDAACGYLLDDRRQATITLGYLKRALDSCPFLGELEKYRDEVVELADAVQSHEFWQSVSETKGVKADYRVIAPSLKSLAHLESGGKEFEVLKNPLRLWRTRVSTSVVSEVLAAEFPHLAAIALDIARLVTGEATESQRPILLVGPPGVGKDSIVRRAAELVGRPVGEYDLAGSSDNRIIKGTCKGWSSATPSHPATICARSRCANPILLYSELDRAGGSRRNGNMHEALLGLAEPTTCRNWFDDGLGVGLDLSAISIAFTANGISAIPAALLNRLRILRVDKPRPEHVRDILRQAQRRVAEEQAVSFEAMPEPSPVVIRKLESAARQGRFNLRLADRIARSLSELHPGMKLH